MANLGIRPRNEESVIMRIVRIILSVVLALFSLLFWYSGFTVPAVAATPYLIIALVLTVATYFVSPFRFHRTREWSQ